MELLIQSTRRFQVWLYTVSHSQLLLRANPRFEGDERIEVLFKGVYWMSLPSILEGLIVEQVDRNSAPAVQKDLGEASLFSGVRKPSPDVLGTDDRVFSVKGEGYEGVVVALAVFVHRDNLPAHEPSGFYEHNLECGVHRRP
jgi:hypothetical protein